MGIGKCYGVTQRIDMVELGPLSVRVVSYLAGMGLDRIPISLLFIMCCFIVIRSILPFKNKYLRVSGMSDLFCIFWLLYITQVVGW